MEITKFKYKDTEATIGVPTSVNELTRMCTEYVYWSYGPEPRRYDWIQGMLLGVISHALSSLIENGLSYRGNGNLATRGYFRETRDEIPIYHGARQTVRNQLLDEGYMLPKLFLNPVDVFLPILGYGYGREWRRLQALLWDNPFDDVIPSPAWRGLEVAYEESASVDPDTRRYSTQRDNERRQFKAFFNILQDFLPPIHIEAVTIRNGTINNYLLSKVRRFIREQPISLLATDISLLMKAIDTYAGYNLGWHPNPDVVEGIQQIVELYRLHRYMYSARHLMTARQMDGLNRENRGLTLRNVANNYQFAYLSERAAIEYTENTNHHWYPMVGDTPTSTVFPDGHYRWRYMLASRIRENTTPGSEPVEFLRDGYAQELTQIHRALLTWQIERWRHQGEEEWRDLHGFNALEVFSDSNDLTTRSIVKSSMRFKISVV